MLSRICRQTLGTCVHTHIYGPDPFGPHLCGLIKYSSSKATHLASQALSAPYPCRTHNCGSLSAGNAGSQVILAGWILPERKARDVSFFHLKDSYGTTQLIVDNSDNSPKLLALSQVPVESVVLIEGTVHIRPPNDRRPGPSGDVDVKVNNFTLLNPATNLPFLPSNPHNLPNSELRARHRYLDLRRTALSDNIKKRSQVAHIIRNVLHDHSFVEVETPVLLRSSPEGAREFLVPTRTYQATLTDSEAAASPLFYALQQSPQQPKQLLICSGGVDRYYQIAKCFRDEDGRKDRQPEFTQVDLEMAFVSWDGSRAPSQDNWRIGGQEVRAVIETLVQQVWRDVQGVELPANFDVMTYRDAMSLYGSDKPDTRFGLQIRDLTPLLREPLAENDLECIVIRKSEDAAFIKASRACDNEASTEHVTLTQNNRRTWLLNSHLVRHSLPNFCQDDQDTINNSLKMRLGDDIWFALRPRVYSGGSTALGRARLRVFELAQSRGDFMPSKDPRFHWITEFPLFTRGDPDKDFLAQGRWSSSHHPFTAPMWEDIEAMYNGGIGSVRGQHYDLVLNGVEIGGGSVRIHDRDMQDHIFTNILQLNDSEKEPFNQLLHALQCGAPPHGGIALGFDRMMAMLCNAQSIRDVIAFPKTSNGTDLLFKSPAAVSDEVLCQYGIQTRSTT